jgi:hypothetical protein
MQREKIAQFGWVTADMLCQVVDGPNTVVYVLEHHFICAARRMGYLLLTRPKVRFLVPSLLDPKFLLADALCVVVTAYAVKPIHILKDGEPCCSQA